jgi:hypothetical protein
MPKDGMRHIYERGSVGGSRVDDLEDRLEVPIKINDWADIPGKLKDFVSLIPPAVS